jgi:hypothetical protein
MEQTLANQHIVVGRLPACPSWCAIDTEYHRLTLDQGYRTHETDGCTVEVQHADGPRAPRVPLFATVQQAEGTGAGCIYREAATFALFDLEEKREVFASCNPDDLRNLAELLLAGADVLDAAHAADGVTV